MRVSTSYVHSDVLTPKSVIYPQEMIIVLGTVGSSKIDHWYPAARGKEMKKETAD